jgi:hypothetical protein
MGLVGYDLAGIGKCFLGIEFLNKRCVALNGLVHEESRTYGDVGILEEPIPYDGGGEAWRASAIESSRTPRVTNWLCQAMSNS